MIRRVLRDGCRLVAAGVGSGMLLAASCSSTEVRQAVFAGVEVAANQLLDAQDDDISFSDWLSSELDD